MTGFGQAVSIVAWRDPAFWSLSTGSDADRQNRTTGIEKNVDPQRSVGCRSPPAVTGQPNFDVLPARQWYFMGAGVVLASDGDRYGKGHASVSRRTARGCRVRPRTVWPGSPHSNCCRRCSCSYKWVIRRWSWQISSSWNHSTTSTGSCSGKVFRSRTTCCNNSSATIRREVSCATGRRPAGRSCS
jgi:hypothetical protein